MIAWCLSCAWLVLIFVVVALHAHFALLWREAAHGTWTWSEARSVETAWAYSKEGMNKSNKGKVVCKQHFYNHKDHMVVELRHIIEI